MSYGHVGVSKNLEGADLVEKEASIVDWGISGGVFQPCHHA